MRHSLARLSPEHGEIVDLVYFPRQIGQRGRGDRRDRPGHREDAHVLRAQEIGGLRCSGLEAAATFIALENVAGRVWHLVKAATGVGLRLSEGRMLRER